jgi:predicted enzyme related to lactoylglutathione lyase
MKITLASLLVSDQEKALGFYTKMLGFEKKDDIPMGEYRWLTVTAPDGMAGVELVLEPLGFEPSRAYQKALYRAGIPATAFLTDDIDSEYLELKARGVKFHGEPQTSGPVRTVLFEDTCGNLINLVQPGK